VRFKSKALLATAVTCIVTVLGCTSNTAGSEYEGASEPRTVPVPATTVTTPLTSFGEGTYEIGATAGKVVPGKYGTVVPATSYGCYWERLSNTGGGFDAIIANENAPKSASVIVTVAATDVAFNSRGCGTWTKR